MSDIQQQLSERFAAALGKAFGGDAAGADPLIRPSANPQFGDYQANVAMSLAKQLGHKPREVAQKILDAVELSDLCAKVEIAGPGFLNLTLKKDVVERETAAMAGSERLGVPPVEKPQTVVVDYSGPNVAKEMHVGHLRSTVIGDSIARVLDFQGHTVLRQNHLGDWGTQFGRVMLGLWYDAVARKLGDVDRLEGWISAVSKVPKRSAEESSEEARQRRAAERRLLDEIVPWHKSAYLNDPRGDNYFVPYIKSSFPDLARLQALYTFATSLTGLESADAYTIPNAARGDIPLTTLPSLIATFVQQPGEDNIQEKEAWRKCCDATISAAQSIYERLDVLLTPKDVRGESHYNDMLPFVVDDLKKLELARISEGALVVYPEGFINADANPLGMIIRKGDGGYLYATTDLAAARYRIDRLTADRIIYVTDSRQSQHFAMVFKVLRQAGWASDHITLDHVPFGTILGKDRKPFKTREGGTVRLVDVLDEAERRAGAIVAEKSQEILPEERDRIAHVVGIGALKYADLSTDRIKDYVFDWDRMLAMDGNTAPYLINAYVRIKSIFRKANSPSQISNLESRITLAAPAERSLALHLLQFPSIVAAVAEHLEPHRLCNYLYELAALFHQFYENCPVLTAPDDATRESRLALCDLVARTLQKGLDLLGIGVVEQM